MWDGLVASVGPGSTGPHAAAFVLGGGAAFLSGVGVAAHVRSVELDEFAGRDDAVEDGFGDDGVVQGFVPVLGVELGSHDGGAAVFPPGEDVQQFAGRVGGDRSGQEVVEHQDIAVVQAAKERQPFRVAAVVDGQLCSPGRRAGSSGRCSRAGRQR